MHPTKPSDIDINLEDDNAVPTYWDWSEIVHEDHSKKILDKAEEISKRARDEAEQLSEQVQDYAEDVKEKVAPVDDKFKRLLPNTKHRVIVAAVVLFAALVIVSKCAGAATVYVQTPTDALPLSIKLDKCKGFKEKVMSETDLILPDSTGNPPYMFCLETDEQT